MKNLKFIGIIPIASLNLNQIDTSVTSKLGELYPDGLFPVIVKATNEVPTNLILVGLRVKVLFPSRDGPG